VSMIRVSHIGVSPKKRDGMRERLGKSRKTEASASIESRRLKGRIRREKKELIAVRRARQQGGTTLSRKGRGGPLFGGGTTMRWSCTSHSDTNTKKQTNTHKTKQPKTKKKNKHTKKKNQHAEQKTKTNKRGGLSKRKEEI